MVITAVFGLEVCILVVNIFDVGTLVFIIDIVGISVVGVFVNDIIDGL